MASAFPLSFDFGSSRSLKAKSDTALSERLIYYYKRFLPVDLDRYANTVKLYVRVVCFAFLCSLRIFII
jgi:hypothetical protein